MLSDLHFELINSPLGGILIKESGHESSNAVVSESQNSTKWFLNLSLYESYTIVKEISWLLVDYNSLSKIQLTEE